MSWLFSRALVEVFSEDICSDGEPSVQSNGNPIQQAYLPPDRMMVFSRLSRFGMTFKPLTEDRGKELLTSYLEVFRAKTYQQQEKEPGSTGLEVECGTTWQESSEKYSQNMSSLKTALPYVLEDLSESSKTLPRSGMMRDGQYWEQPMSVLRTKEIGCGLWLTPTVCGNYNRKGASATSGDGLATAIMKWPTPNCQDHKAGMSNSPGRQQISLPRSVAISLGVTQKECGGLNPTWVEWLMGWPLGWTDLKPLEMDKYQQWQQQHSFI